MKKVQELFMKTPPIFRYLVNSCIVTVIDVIIVWALNIGFGMGIVYANTIGVVAGFLLDYMLSLLFVFKGAKGTGGFAIYLGTFLFGLVLADALIYWGNHRLFADFDQLWNFIFSKGLSIVIPFFVLYFMRKGMYYFREKRLAQMESKA